MFLLFHIYYMYCQEGFEVMYNKSTRIISLKHNSLQDRNYGKCDHKCDSWLRMCLVKIKRKYDRQWLKQERSLFFWNKKKFWSPGQPHNALSRLGCFHLAAPLSPDCGFQSHGCKMLAAPQVSWLCSRQGRGTEEKGCMGTPAEFHLLNSFPRSHT